ncbi:SDR family oxidoreductase [Parachryseolinea silvisoli]|jgi:NAD(P)-dependent dehydrogenase (short-subunit alcohol dehydrogenase family)|uniref:SDR family oxidoreductase n=1 Tax=Parachryseolinea silvisoli TaxID=2873601 RepID=UPI002265A89D|nr:SDR family oxidoreductase [Parachryseolinea silvisoli]
METTHVKMPKNIPPQHQEQQPGIEAEMIPAPVYDNDDPGLGRLNGKVAIITGGDSGIGRAVAVQFAKEGADVAIAYLDENLDAAETAEAMRKYGKEALLIAADVSKESECKLIVEETINRFGKIDIVVNNAAVQYEQKSVEDISADQLEHTFKVNIFAHFHLCKYALPHLKPGSVIINTASITAYRGNPSLIDYSSTKGAIVAFTRSLSQAVADRGIRVNAVAPGPVWTPLIPASFDEEKVAKFGKDTTLKRPAQPIEIAPCYVFLASKESAFITGQVLHPNGGTVVNT